ncbi:MAG: TetR family transcriptional regulator [Bacteroidia bacterium]|nr:TetR family transcriptional regulator [Bacteroidia bacterium]
MAATDFVKKAYCEALLSLCNEKPLNDITVADVVAKAGTAKQTFYNRFRDINDLISYIPINYMETCLSAETDFKSVLIKTNSYALENKSFYCQLPFHKAQNNFRDSFLDWSIEIHSKKCNLDKSDENYLEKKLAIYLHCYGAIELFLEWCRRKMDWPVEAIVKAIFEDCPSSFFN